MLKEQVKQKNGSSIMGLRSTFAAASGSSAKADRMENDEEEDDGAEEVEEEKDTKPESSNKSASVIKKPLKGSRPSSANQTKQMVWF